MSPEAEPQPSEAEAMAIVPKVAWQDSNTSDEKGDDCSEQKPLVTGCNHQLDLAPENADLLSRDIMSDTFAALPLKPKQVMRTGNTQIECCVVGETPSGQMAVDMQVTQKFRAYYDANELRKAKECRQPIQRPAPPRLSGASKPMLLSEIVHEDCEGHLPALPPSGDGQVPCQWIVDSSQVQLNRRLAVGGFAEVFLGQYAGTRVAVKRLFAQTNHEEFRQEVRMLAQLRHPNLLLFMGYTMYPSLAIITEYMQRGSLYNIISKRGNIPLETKLQRSVALSVARGMAYLHSRSPPILHLDLKSANILVDNAWRVKLGDFGLSRIRINSFMSSAASSGGTPQWMAPEVLRSERYDEAADVYSFGVVLWEVLTGKAPWADMHAMQVVGAVGFQGRMLPRPSSPDADPFLVELCMLCMRPNPRERPMFSAMVDALDEHFNHRPGSSSSSASLAHVTGTVPPVAEEQESPRALFSPPHGESSVGTAPHSSGRLSIRTISNASSEGRAPLPDDEQLPFAHPDNASEPAEFQDKELPKMYGLFRQPSIVSPFADSEVAPTARQTPLVSPFTDGLGSPTSMAEMSLAQEAESSGVAADPRIVSEASRQESIISPFLQTNDGSEGVEAVTTDFSGLSVDVAAPNAVGARGPETSPPSLAKEWHSASSGQFPTSSPFEVAPTGSEVEEVDPTPEAAELSPPHTPTQHPMRLQGPPSNGFPAHSGVSNAKQQVPADGLLMLKPSRGPASRHGSRDPDRSAEDASHFPDTDQTPSAPPSNTQGRKSGKIMRAFSDARRRWTCSTK
ncbi:uncharacterized protein LOC142358022 [Convolutriloba macropyga]|uniref:uncharacterized protein LOC142358022 n=1 Tax=Convolutriloba macropyga TaxID=536237 RepID=UPI003F51F764